MGHPTGSGIHNAPSSWNWLNQKKEKDPFLYKICDAGKLSLHRRSCREKDLFLSFDLTSSRKRAHCVSLSPSGVPFCFCSYGHPEGYACSVSHRGDARVYKLVNYPT